MLCVGTSGSTPRRTPSASSSGGGREREASVSADAELILQPTGLLRLVPHYHAIYRRSYNVWDRLVFEPEIFSPRNGRGGGHVNTRHNYECDTCALAEPLPMRTIDRSYFGHVSYYLRAYISRAMNFGTKKGKTPSK